MFLLSLDLEKRHLWLKALLIYTLEIWKPNTADGLKCPWPTLACTRLTHYLARPPFFLHLSFYGHFSICWQMNEETPLTCMLDDVSS